LLTPVPPSGTTGFLWQSFGYNSRWHSTLGRSPFEVLYGYSPRHFGIDPSSACSSTDLSTWLQERQVMKGLIKQHRSRAQDRMKQQVDKGRSERQFQVGDMVYLKLQPYVQSSLAPRANQKLSFKFFGPFRVLSRVVRLHTSWSFHHLLLLTLCSTSLSLSTQLVIRWSLLLYQKVITISRHLNASCSSA
jgi:hypothetical protein